MTDKQKIDAILGEMPESIEKWGVAFAVGSVICAGKSMAEVAQRLGCSRAAISHKARQFCDRHNLEPSPYMKSSK
jgi:hypothetical protein